MKRAVAMVAFLTIISPSMAAPPSILGIWVDADNEYSYGFFKDNELTIKFRCDTCAPRDSEITGVWQYKPDACLDEKKKPIGNLSLRYGNVFCCMSAEFVGKKLTLFAYGANEYDRTGACRTRVLSRETSK